MRVRSIGSATLFFDGDVFPGCVQFTPMPCEPASEVAVLPMKVLVRRKPLDMTLKNHVM